MKDITTYLKEKREMHLQELFTFLSIPSISALPEHQEDIQNTALWLSNSLSHVGLENVEIYQTKGNPVIYADWLHAKGKPTVLIYGHYDVQPVDPLELWESPPFSPEIRDEKLYARGASDDKGQVFMHIKAIEAMLNATGTLPVNVKFCLEGEEEIGSPTLPLFVENNAALLNADVLVISDTGMIEKGKPTICYGLRGLCGLEVHVKGPKSDLHSGLFGGSIQNPVTAIVELLSTFHNSDGQITVEGFYDKVDSLSQVELEAFHALNISDESYLEQTGSTSLFGENGYSTVERVWTRPTLELNGIKGGFQGTGVKTVIPSEASAKITCRLVPSQDPEEIVSLLISHIEKHKPKGIDVSISLFDKGKPFITPFDHKAIQAASRSYEKVYHVPTSFTRGGGSIPIVSVFDEILKIPVVLMGFGLPDENFHAPNEHFHLENYDKGLETICTYWYELASVW